MIVPKSFRTVRRTRSQSQSPSSVVVAKTWRSPPQLFGRSARGARSAAHGRVFTRPMGGRCEWNYVFVFGFGLPGEGRMREVVSGSKFRLWDEGSGKFENPR